VRFVLTEDHSVRTGKEKPGREIFLISLTDLAESFVILFLTSKIL